MSAQQDYRLDDRYRADEGTVFLTGIQALARLPFEQLRADRAAGLRTAAFVSGYQGSPLGGYGDAVERAARVDKDLPVVFRQAMNEEYGATAVMGSQLASARPDVRYDGIVGIWYGKAPGVDRAADALRHANFAGTSMNGGAIAIVGDDPNAKSSTIPSSSAGLLFGMHMPIFYPGDPAEALDLGRHAITMSRATGLWSAIKIVADVADATASVDLHPERIQPIMPLVDGERYQHTPYGQLLTPLTLDIEREIVEVRYELARQYATDNRLNQVVVDPPDAWVGIVSSGITYREVREALHRLGLSDDATIAAAGIRLLKMGVPVPFNRALVRTFARGLVELIVVEEKQPNIESAIRDALYATTDRPLIVGKTDERDRLMFASWGALDADEIVPVLRRRLAPRLEERLAPLPVQRTLLPLAVERTPFYCSGCPHNRSTEVPDGALVGAGIGCHTMTLLMDPSRVGEIVGITCMGNEGTQWIGMSDFVDTPHLFQNLGDGTFFHSGQLAVQAAVAAGVNITYKLLYNGTVAMTGGQDPEAQLSVAQVATMLLTQGVAKVLITTDTDSRYRTRADGLPGGVEVWDRSRLIEAQELLARVPGVTVLIHDQACAAEARRDRKLGLVETPNQRVVINPRLCEGCGDCGQVSNCLSVQPIDTPFGRKTRIDQTTCNLDFSCLEGDCPSFMTVHQPSSSRLARLARRIKRLVAGRAGAAKASARPRGRSTAAASLPPLSPLPAPVLIVPRDSFAMRITGIGGTGVVTAAQVIGTAAMLDGFEVRGLDQIGLSQKAGPVVSDVRLSRFAPSHTNRLGVGQADLLLAFDQLVAASDKGLSACAPGHTVVVGSTSATPTGAMITHPDIAMPQHGRLRQIIEDQSSSTQQWADAEAITGDLFGSSTTANVFVIGMALQVGALPIDPARIEEAIRLNAVAVEANLTALAWGRAFVSNPDLVDRARRDRQDSPGTSPALHSDPHREGLDRLDVSPSDRGRLALLASELEAWGTLADVARWLDVLDRVQRAERRADPNSTRLVMAVADGLYKLTAYKDEYEVARLMLDEEALAEVRHVAGAEGRIVYRLHPPILRALGVNDKISIGEWAKPTVRVLARGKLLRGTPLDPFGRARVRRVERELPVEYLAAIDGLLPTLNDANLPKAVAIAELAELVRGYEDIKLANVERFRTALAEALNMF